MMQHYAINSYAIKLDIPKLRVIPKRHWRVIVEAVAVAFDVPVSGILSTSQRRDYAWARQAAYLLIKQERGFPLCMIGRLMGRDHGTVHHGIQAALNRIENDPEFAAAYRKAKRG